VPPNRLAGGYAASPCPGWLKEMMDTTGRG